MATIRTSEIVWHREDTGLTQLWFMRGNQIAGQAAVAGEDGVTALVRAPFRIVGVGDFDGDGRADILWYHNQTGESQIWFMDGHRVARRGTVLGENGRPVFIGPPFRIVGVGDFDGDGKVDILWYHDQTGESQIWFMDGHRIVRRGTVLGLDKRPAFIGPPFRIVGAGDFDGDGKADILWYHDQTGESQIWFMDGHQLMDRGTVHDQNGQAAFVGPPNRIVGVSDFDGNGKADLLWYNEQTLESQVWFMERHRVVRRDVVLDEGGRAARVGLPFRIAGSGLAVQLPEVTVRYVGFRCFGTTDGLGDDEPKFFFGVAPTLAEKRQSSETKIYDGVEGGTSHADRVDQIELYRGLPYGLIILVILIEHDTGDPNRFRSAIDSAVNSAATRTVAALGTIPAVGAALVVVSQILAVVGVPALTDAINELLGSGDDELGRHSILLEPLDMLKLARSPHQDFFGIRAHLETPLFDGHGGSYKAYFEVVT